MKRITIVLLSLLLFVCISPAGIKAEDDQDMETYAYAVLDYKGNLVFFRSNTPYLNKDTGSFYDTKGFVYNGILYADFEEDPNGNMWY